MRLASYITSKKNSLLCSLLLAWSWLGLTACSQLFYYPTDEIVLTPAKMELAYEEHFIPSEDDISLGVWWIKAIPEKKLHRIVVQLHGNGENMSTHFLYVAWLAKEGYDVITFDYRGYGQSTAEMPTQKGLAIDTCAVLGWLAQHPALKEQPTFIIGQSLGGAVVPVALHRCPYPPLRGIVIDSSFASYRDIARRKLASFWLSWPLQYPLSYLIADDPRPDAVIGAVKVPFIFFHNPDDPVVPFEEGQALYAAAGNPKEFIEVHANGHTAAFGRRDSPYRPMVLDFFNRVAGDSVKKQ